MSVDIAKLTVPVLIGTLLNWAGFGVLAVQVCIYFLAFPGDRTFTKVLVVFVLVLEILETLSNTHDTIRMFGTDWGNMAVLDEVGWAWFSVPIIGSISAAVGQSFFAWRIYIIGHNKYIPAVILALTAVQLGSGVWSGVNICLAKRFSQLQYDNVKATATWLAATSSCDLIIVSSMIFYIMKSRKPEFKNTNLILGRIIKITVETGLLCALCAIADLYLFVTYKGTNYHLGLCIELSKVYSNSILLILNSRAHIGHSSANASQTRYNSSNLVFRSGTRVPISVEINHESSIRTDPDENYGKMVV
ncbi:hypothetical protein C8R44DRAFT_769144 [Mycena epipterygia]|nr:hypothetical protein C8R44DRAFT_769144 [Mycena epipterygia]